MTLIPNIAPASTQRVEACGPRDAEIILLGEAPGATEVKTRRPFTGPAGDVLNQCLSAAGILRSECYITNVIKERPSGNNIEPFYKERGGFTELADPYLEELRDELARHPARMVVALGRIALAALRGSVGASANRGYVAAIDGGPIGPMDKLCLSTLHPATVLYGQYMNRYVIAADLAKARSRVELDNYKVEYPCEPIITTDLSEALWELGALKGASPLACDIELQQNELSHLGFATRERAISIDLASAAWLPSEELQVWLVTAKLLGDPTTEKAFQNGMFDIVFLLQKCRIMTRGPILDSMVYWSIMNPDFPKNLGFIASIVCDVPEWKSMVRFKGSEVKKKDD